MNNSEIYKIFTNGLNLVVNSANNQGSLFCTNLVNKIFEDQNLKNRSISYTNIDDNVLDFFILYKAILKSDINIFDINNLSIKNTFFNQYLLYFLGNKLFNDENINILIIRNSLYEVDNSTLAFIARSIIHPITDSKFTLAKHRELEINHYMYDLDELCKGIYEK